MTPPHPDIPHPADEPLDDVDFRLLDDIRGMFDAADPMPADLPERIRFFLALRDLEIEVARLAEEDSRPWPSAAPSRAARSLSTATA